MRQQYESYKPSDIDWIGDIPSHWKLPRVKQFVKINNGSDPKTEGNIPVYGSGSYSFKTCGEFKLGPTVLLGRKGATLHIPHWIEGKYWNVDTAFDTNMIGDLNLRLFFYFSMLFNYEKYKSETTLPSMTQTDYGNMYIPLPPLAEHEAIAAWLDKKCGEIDAAIAKVDREIELIDELKRSEISRVVTRGLNPDAPLRSSGIDWIGDIPEHWTKCRFKNFMYLKTTPSYSQVKIGLENLESGSSKFIESDTEFDGNGVEFCQNDILYGKLRPYLRKVWLAEFNGNAVGDFFVFGNCSNSAASYLKYLLLSDGFTKQADGSTFGAKMPRVSSEFILTLPFYLPPLPEQQEIADYLDKKCAEIDGLKAKLTKKRETLKELRQSIISEVVTGKHKIT